jgi:hypothetical protein
MNDRVLGFLIVNENENENENEEVIADELHP